MRCDLTVFDISGFPSISFAAAMATVERRAPATASSWEPKAARTPVTNGAANGSAAREQYTDHPSTTTGSGTGVQLLFFLQQRSVCHVVMVWNYLCVGRRGI